MSTRDKKLLIILAGVAILALTYFLIFIPQSNKRDSLKSENMNLKSQYNQLSALAAKADDYTKKTKDMSDAMQQVYDNFPSYLQIENGIMDAVAIEKSTNTNITELTVGSPTAIDVNNPTGEAGTDSSSGSTTDSSNTDSSQSSQTADGNSSQSQTDDGSAAGSGTSSGSAKSTVTGYQLYDVSTVMAFKTEYHGLKAMLGEVIGSSQKKTISTLNVSFDDSTGKLTGEMLVDSYFLYGLDKPYEAPYIPAVPHGTNNLFGTTN
ncbi:type II secretion system protein GspM [Agathobacter rectalis]|jgi:type II secretory pathway pseudopilin PulG|uniref:Pilus assembly protein PilO n=1 Tax=Agathobacter rectalis TaxID=39491 RepID=A0A396FPG0_9FIRM|nr:type II secretion system protein GspM [Agathobacter rectalis]RGT79030.1 pilus assembly protein PilO [Agathobacter rectalis]RGT84220.1 pilus assembly protein PilO [Agathobacter rectalis]RGZ16995.1 pilus assembly protein PilO [Agathobacter rectalis]RGZ74433.1 pilus assembly protein PilO [Agathobacter rectalis]RHA04135.1 pilus assembly protein PilO [Agathobacter rectalis]